MAETHEWYHDEASGQYIQTVTVMLNAPVDVCFERWSNFEDFPSIMSYVNEVKKSGENRWHWEANIGGVPVNWDAEMTDFSPNEVIAWRSVDGLKNSGEVRFTPQGMGGCLISVRLQYDPPYGWVGDLVARQSLNDKFHDQLQLDLDNFKRTVEAEQGRQAA
ncbi:MAG: SRPBCC family protein [Armatimonadota bacterium]